MFTYQGPAGLRLVFLSIAVSVDRISSPTLSQALVRDLLARLAVGYDDELWVKLPKTPSLYVDIRKMRVMSLVRSRSALIESITYFGVSYTVSAAVAVEVFPSKIRIATMNTGEKVHQDIELRTTCGRNISFLLAARNILKSRYGRSATNHPCLDCGGNHPILEVQLKVGFFDPELLPGPDKTDSSPVGVDAPCSFKRRDHDYGGGCHMSLCAFVSMLE